MNSTTYDELNLYDFFSKYDKYHNYIYRTLVHRRPVIENKK